MPAPSLPQRALPDVQVRNCVAGGGHVGPEPRSDVGRQLKLENLAERIYLADHVLARAGNRERSVRIPDDRRAFQKHHSAAGREPQGEIGALEKLRHAIKQPRSDRIGPAEP